MSRRNAKIQIQVKSPPVDILLTVPRQYFFCGSFVLFMSCVCHALASVHCCLVVTWRERADLLALVCDVIVILLLSHLGSCDRCGTWFNRFLILAVSFTLIFPCNFSLFGISIIRNACLKGSYLDNDFDFYLNRIKRYNFFGSCFLPIWSKQSVRNWNVPAVTHRLLITFANILDVLKRLTLKKSAGDSKSMDNYQACRELTLG